MSGIAKLRKDEMQLVAEEIGLSVSEGAKKIDLKILIEESDVFKNDYDFVKGVIDQVLEEKKNKKADQDIQIELERLKLDRINAELKLAQLKAETSKVDTSFDSECESGSAESIDAIIKSVRILTIKVPNKSEGWGFFFTSLERAFSTKKVPEKFKAEILLNLLGERASNILTYITEKDLNNYEEIKLIVLREFEPTAQAVLQNFRNATRENETHLQFASRLTASFDYYLKLREVIDFESLKQLIVSDKLFQTLDRDTAAHISVRQAGKWFKPIELGKECDLYFSSRGKQINEAKGEQKIYNKFKPSKTASKVFFNEKKNKNCDLCLNKESHPLYACPQFKRLSVHERVEIVKNKNVCFKCLSENCSVKKCSYKNCFCGKAHNRLIHFSRDRKNESSNITCGRTSSNEGASQLQSGGENECKSSEWAPLVAANVMKNKCVILSTVKCLLKDKYSRWQEVRCLLDVGSQVSLMSNECLQRLQLKSEKINQSIFCINDASLVIHRRVSAIFANKNKSFERDISMLVVPKITDLIPNQMMDVRVQIPETIALADPNFNIPGKIDILIGAEYFYDIIKPGKLVAKNANLTLQNSEFGYILAGSISSSDKLNSKYCGLICGTEELNSNLRKFWEIEEIGNDLPKSKENLICEEHYARTHRRDKSGKYTVTMPLKEHWSCLGNSRDIALKRLESLWARLSRDQKYQKLYTEFLNEYKNLNHMSEVKDNIEPEGAYYMPHHGVYKPEKSTTKLRTVFNASTLTSSGKSLNSIQYNGGVIQDDLFSLLVRFRKHLFAFTADIRQMYRMINVDESQRHLQRILWKEDVNEPVKVYQLNTVTYGTVSAPFLAMRTLKQIAIDEGKNFPIAATVLSNDLYMDDILSGANTLEGAKTLQHQLIEILKTAQMSLHKWCGNTYELIPTTEKEYDFASSDEVKTLGIAWKAKTDCFNFKVDVVDNVNPTKRSVLSVIARLFDPLGLLGPVITKAKIFMQRLWLLKIDWSEKLPEKEACEWREFVRSLRILNDINIERCIVIQNAEITQLHGFSDASENAYGAVIYARSVTSEGEVKVKLIASKSRVSPIKQVTIPRLELCSAVLLTKLMRKVRTALKMDITEVFYWTDSTIVLSWMNKESIELKTFVANRVVIIQEHSDLNQWHHVPSEQNPADIISRGLDPKKISQSDLWFFGPPFLQVRVVNFPGINNEVQNNELHNKELKREHPISKREWNNRQDDYLDELYLSSDSNCAFHIKTSNFVNDLLNLNNNYVTILRILGFIYRFIQNARNPLYKSTGPLDPMELKRAETIIRKVQEEHFADEVRCLQKRVAISQRSKLSTLNPFLDADSILRVGGRLGKSDLDFEQKYPIVLPKNHKLTFCIIVYYHEKYCHVGASSLLSFVREKFWPLNGRSTCRKIVHNCTICFKIRPIISSQLMGNLPKDRVTPDYPFNCSGVDFCGPFLVKYKNQRKGILHKMYVCLFICFATRAVHMEIVSELTSEAFIACLKRFTSRRGKCAKLCSDNATNFVGANKELKRLHEIVNKPEVILANYLANEGIDWKFIPPRSPNFGGLWEAAIKSFKYHFVRVVRGSNLDYEEFLTVVIQVEGILNSRPLCPMVTNDDDFSVLTPAHFLIQRPLISIHEPDLTNLKENQLKKWQKLIKITQLIWKKWQRKYLNELQQRGKWRFEKNNVNIGDLVILVEDNLPTYKWPLGRIIEVYYGDDKKIRVVKIKTQSGTFKRAISKICLLPMPE